MEERRRAPTTSASQWRAPRARRPDNRPEPRAEPSNAQVRPWLAFHIRFTVVSRDPFLAQNKETGQTTPCLTCENLVGVTRFELVTSSVSGKRSPPELNALSFGCRSRSKEHYSGTAPSVQREISNKLACSSSPAYRSLQLSRRPAVVCPLGNRIGEVHY